MSYARFQTPVHSLPGKGPTLFGQQEPSNALGRRCSVCPCPATSQHAWMLTSFKSWKERMEQRLLKLEEMMAASSQQKEPNSHPAQAMSQAEQRQRPSTMSENSPQDEPHHQSTSTPTAPEVSLNLSCSLGSYPGSSVTTILNPETGQHAPQKADIVSSGVISLEAAEDLFSVYQTSMDPLLHRVLLEDDCLANVRARSSFLTAAVCTVAALHTASDNYTGCYEAFVQQVSAKFLRSSHTFDDVRALCIGAFWLHKISSNIISLGTSIASHAKIS